MPCNPYPSGRLITRCVMEFSTTDGGPLSFAWYSRTQLGSIPQPVPSGFASSILGSKAESTLTIRLQNGTVSESACGDFSGYFCRVSFHNGTILSNSQEVYLFPQYAISNSLGNCDMRSVQSSRVTKCVDPQFSTAEPVTPPLPPTTTSRSPPITTSSSPPTTTILPPTTVPIVMETTTTAKLPPTTTNSQLPTAKMSDSATPQTTPDDDTLLIITTHSRPGAPPIMTSSPAPPQVEEAPTTLPLPPQDSPTTSSSSAQDIPTTSSDLESLPPLPLTTPMTNQLDNSLSSLTKSPSANEVEMPSDDDSSGFTFDEEILLYSAIGAVVVLIMIVITLLLCLCLWNRVCKKSKYCMCCSYY